MGLYKILEKTSNNRTLKNYEAIIERINEYYTKFSEVYKNSIYLDSQIDSCIMRGDDAFSEYLGDYLSSSFVEDEFLKLKKILNNYSKQQPNIDRCYKLIDSLIQTSSFEDKEEILKKDWTSKLEYLFDASNTDSKNYNNTYLFIIGAYFIKQYKDVLTKISPLVEEKVQTGKSFIDSIKEVLDSKKIVIDDKKILSTFYSTRKRQSEYNAKLREVYKDKYIKNFFIAKTNELKSRVKIELESGKSKEEVLEEILPMAYGLVKAACEYTKGLVAYDVQLMGAIAINEGKVAEMYTGEGKTLTAIFAAYLNALTNQEVNIFTPNDYLSSRDAKDNKDIYNLLGLTVGCTLVDGQSIEEKKQAYRSDIVYGSSTAFAFDFLKDTNADYSSMVCRGEKPGFVIVDEADQILINNALNPYQLSGGVSLTKQDILDNNQAKYYISLALEIEKMLSKSKYIANNQYEYECITGDNKEYTDKLNNLYSLLIGLDDVYLTSKGEKKLFYYFMYDKAQELVEQASSYFKENDQYVLGTDYLIKDDKIVLTVDGFDRACKEIDEFAKLNMKWLTDEESLVIRKYLNNALIARYVMKKGKNYQVGIDPITSEQCIFVLQDGRIMPDSKFTEGLHQAIEVKEGLDIQISKGERLIDSVIATISNRALLARYDKISGMTGTASYDAFSEIYGLETFKVPRNKEYLYKKGAISKPPCKRQDHPVVLCKSDEIKMQCILKETMKGYLKAQPVLILSDDDEIVKFVFDRITKVDSRLNPNLLISDKTLEEEAQIIAQAGIKNAITVASEMAGRGTDIKLGGFSSTNKDEAVKEVLLEKVSQFFQKSGAPKDQDIFDKVLEILKLEYEQSESYRREIDSIAEKRIAALLEEFYKAGGLKYIQVNPFRTSRNDNQGKGRVGRGGEPGETIMYVTLDDLIKLGADKQEIQNLTNLLGDKEMIDDISANGMVSEVIDTLQQINEYNDNIRIASTDTMDLAMSSIGFRILKQRTDLIMSEDIIPKLDSSIQVVVEDVLSDSLSKKDQRKATQDSYRLSKLGIDFNTLNTSLMGIFGVEISREEVFSSCTDVSDLKQFISDKAISKLESFSDKEKMDKKIKNTLISQINQVYKEFLYSAKSVELQRFNDVLAGNTSHDRIAELETIYKECNLDILRKTLKGLFKPNLKVKQDESFVYDSEIQVDLPTISDLINKKH